MFFFFFFRSQIISNVGMYGMMAVSGQKALARLRPLGLLPGAAARLQPVSKALAAPVKRALAGPVRQAIARKPVVVGTTAAVATLAGGPGAGSPRCLLPLSCMFPVLLACLWLHGMLVAVLHLSPLQQPTLHPPFPRPPCPAASSAQAPMIQETVTVGARVATTLRTAAQATLVSAGEAPLATSAANQMPHQHSMASAA